MWLLNFVIYCIEFFGTCALLEIIFLYLYSLKH